MARFVADIATRLSSHADPKTRDWWTRYLRGEARFRGVKMAQIRSVVASLHDEHELSRRAISDVLDLARACMAQAHSEDKLAGILLLGEHALDRLRLRHVPVLARPLRDGHLADWNVVDWYGVRVLSPFIVRGTDVEARARRIAGWSRAKGLWQRRAAAVSFVHHARDAKPLFPGLVPLILDICAANVRDPARFSQTSVGWLLRELSHHHAPAVRDFLRTHASAMSAEALRAARKHL